MKVSAEIILKKDEWDLSLVNKICNDLHALGVFKVIEFSSGMVMSEMVMLRFKSEWSAESVADLVRFLVETEREEVTNLVLRGKEDGDVGV